MDKRLEKKNRGRTASPNRNRLVQPFLLGQCKSTNGIAYTYKHSQIAENNFKSDKRGL